MRLNKHWVRILFMQRDTSHRIAAGATCNQDYNTRLQKMRYLSNGVLPEEEECGLFGKQMTGKLNERQKAVREKFLEAEIQWNKLIEWNCLNKDEIEIVKAHQRAVIDGHFTYDDAILKKKVMTRLRHFLRGSCCGNACRHVCEICYFKYTSTTK